MQLAEHNNKLVTNLQNNQVQNFGIGDASVVIDILRNRLYEHKIRTLVQEYICNARDAMRELGKFDNNFEVVVPNRLNPVFKVRDFGMGITPDRIANVFVLYGSSTKRASNIQTGGFGIGAKSAWSYTDSFSITTFVEGIKRSYVAHIGVNNNGRLDLVSETPTDEPNGTEIAIAVKQDDLGEFKDSIYRAIYFWDKKPTLRGELTPPPCPTLFKINDKMATCNSGNLPSFVNIGYHSDSVILVIDGIIYSCRLTDKIGSLKSLNRHIKQHLVLLMDNGIVEVSASRESVADSKVTCDNLGLYCTERLQEYNDFIKAEFKKVVDNTTFIETYKRLEPSFYIEEHSKYGNYSIGRGFLNSELFKKINIIKMSHMTKGYKKSDKVQKNDAFNSFRIDEMKDMFFLNTEEKNHITLKRAKEYLKTHKYLYLVTPKVINDVMENIDDIIKDLSLIDFQSVTYPETVKQPRVKGVTPKREIFLHTFTGHDGRRDTLTTDNLTNTIDWLYVEMEGLNFKGYSFNELQELAKFLYLNYAIHLCGVSSKYMKAIKGDSHFNPLSTWLTTFKPKAKDIAYINAQSAKNDSEIETLARTNIKEIKDTHIQKMIPLYSTLSTGTRVPYILRDIVALHPECIEFKKNDSILTNLLDKNYSLVKDYRGSRNPNELVYYINAKHEMKESSK